MRRQWKAWAIALGIVFTLGAAAYFVRRPHGTELRQTVVPGTGVSLALPEDVVISPLGTMFANKDASILISVTTGPSANNPLERGVFKQAFSPSVEKFHNATLDGTLLHRTRKLDGGGWDGWVLVVVRGDRLLVVQVGYQGTRDESLDPLRKVLDTVSWDERTLDPEAAFGLQVNPPGLQLEQGATGGLAYSVDGGPSPNEPNINIMAAPIRSSGGAEIFHQLCEKASLATFKGRLPAPLQYTTTNGVSLCDTQGDSVLKDPDYFAAVEFPDGAMMTAWGRGDASALRQSLLNAKRISR